MVFEDDQNNLKTDKIWRKMLKFPFYRVKVIFVLLGSVSLFMNFSLKDILQVKQKKHAN